MPAGSVVTIGNFDGVHFGHRAILRRARELADRYGAQVVALTFAPHPAAVLRPGHEPPRLSTLRERCELIREAGADRVEVLKPTPQLLSLSPQQFIERVVDEYRPVAIVEGRDFRFGKSRSGDVELLKELGLRMGFDAQVVAPVVLALHDQLTAPVSSTLVRWLVSGGRVADAALCLGRAYALTAPVARGEQRGRTIGFPTLNLDPATLHDESGAPLVLPPDAVYAGTVTLDLPHPSAAPANPKSEIRNPKFRAAISVGIKPTFGTTTRVIEAHLLDFNGDLYDRTVTLSFGRWLRDQQAFPSVDALRAQLARDVAETRRLHTLELLHPPFHARSA